MIEQVIRTHSLDVQFWGYELGNLTAALAATGWIILIGGGGLPLGPDVIVPLVLAGLILTVALGSRLLIACGLVRLIPVLNWLTAGLGAVLLTWAFAAGQSWLGTAAVAFLTGSALIRLTDRHGALLKLGAVFLVVGGLSLCGFGLGQAASLGGAVPVLTALTGFYVTAGGVLTYIGGIRLCRVLPAPESWLDRLLARGTAPLDAPTATAPAHRSAGDFLGSGPDPRRAAVPDLDVGAVAVPADDRGRGDFHTDTRRLPLRARQLSLGGRGCGHRCSGSAWALSP